MNLDLVVPEDHEKLVTYSAQIGANPTLIQAAGGNTSIKENDVMWIKASGTLLAEARNRNIFVPVDLAKMRNSIEKQEARADQPAEFLLDTGALKPSIETSLHAIFKQKIVVHVHCVNTLAHAIRTDCKALVSEKLKHFDWCLIPYRKPGADLASEVRRKLGPDTNVVVLANHGLLIAADNVAAAEQLLIDVVSALQISPALFQSTNTSALKSILPEVYYVPDDKDPVHQLALNSQRIDFATRGSLYPDHVIFCGVGATSLNIAEINKIDTTNAPLFIIFPNMGVIIRRDASEGNLALIQCLADVLARVPNDAELNYLSAEQNYELIDWDAEKYRLALNAK